MRYYLQLPGTELALLLGLITISEDQAEKLRAADYPSRTHEGLYGPFEIFYLDREVGHV